eukprot:scaffold292409_cov14-Tisochrysis_lutea.AAC.1
MYDLRKEVSKAADKEGGGDGGLLIAICMPVCGPHRLHLHVGLCMWMSRQTGCVVNMATACS